MLCAGKIQTEVTLYRTFIKQIIALNIFYIFKNIKMKGNFLSQNDSTTFYVCMLKALHVIFLTILACL